MSDDGDKWSECAIEQCGKRLDRENAPTVPVRRPNHGPICLSCTPAYNAGKADATPAFWTRLAEAAETTAPAIDRLGEAVYDAATKLYRLESLIKSIDNREQHGVGENAPYAHKDAGG